jgi:hypothetical protein
MNEIAVLAIVLGVVGSVLAALMAWSSCKVAGDADERMGWK